ncbi:cryptochrome/photolyase family protein [uncultured Aliiroseovarius sp.]|uniref:cryptochrome/photolyase family protein n=1 Tax=uncultured Aliiroseovarius sp. TaxID=1658783 RepID=UPI00261B7F03|nr:cryptochrome/photolyase family protein [uncultured Aliiroseovarius sp.]
MRGNQPEGDRWTYDAENRSLKRDLFMPQPFQISPDAIPNEVLDLVEAKLADNFGTLRPFWHSVTWDGAHDALSPFIEHSLPQFGA